MNPRARWIDQNGMPTQAFYKCILGIFEILGTNSPGTLVPDGSITTVKLANAAVTGVKLASAAVSNAKLAQGPASTLKGNPTGAPASEVDLPLGTGLAFSSGQLVALQVFSKSFASAQQTITVAGALTLAHGLGSMPFGLGLRLHCTGAEAGYSIGDEVEVALGLCDALGQNRGCS